MVTLDDIQRTLLNIERLLHKQAKMEPPADRPVLERAKSGPNTAERIASQLAAWITDCKYKIRVQDMISPEGARSMQNEPIGSYDTLELRFLDFPDIAAAGDVLALFFQTRKAWLVKLQPDLRNHQTAVSLTVEDKGIHFVVEGPGPDYLVRIRAAGR